MIFKTLVIRIVSGATPPSVMTLFEESSLHIVIGRATYSLEISLVTYISLALYVFSWNQFGDGKKDTVWPSKVEVVEELVFFATFRNSPSSEQHIPIVNMILFWLDLENISNKNTKIDSASDVFLKEVLLNLHLALCSPMLRIFATLRLWGWSPQECGMSADWKRGTGDHRNSFCQKILTWHAPFPPPPLPLLEGKIGALGGGGGLQVNSDSPKKDSRQLDWPLPTPPQVSRMAKSFPHLPQQLPRTLWIHYSCHQGHLQWRSFKVPHLSNIHTECFTLEHQLSPNSPYAPNHPCSGYS